MKISLPGFAVLISRIVQGFDLKMAKRPWQEALAWLSRDTPALHRELEIGRRPTSTASYSSSVRVADMAKLALNE